MSCIVFNNFFYFFSHHPMALLKYVLNLPCYKEKEGRDDVVPNLSSILEDFDEEALFPSLDGTALFDDICTMNHRCARINTHTLRLLM